MGVSVHGTVHPHLHSPCPVCGYARRFKQFGPMRCACPSMSAGRSTSPLVAEIQAEQEQKNAALPIPSGPPLRIADQYSAGRPHR